MSRTFKDRKGYKTRRKSYITKRTRGGYEDYDHSDQELYVYDQSCDNCCYCNHCRHTPFASNWCEYWRGCGGGCH